QTYNVTHYLHGHLHMDWHHYWNGVHHICAPQTYPYTDDQNLGGYIEYTVTQGNITSWKHYTDGVENPLNEPATTTAAPPSSTTTSTTSGTPGFTWVITIVAIPSIIIYSKKRRN
ncbi:MAG: Heimdall-CTERM domain-containing surface protein, partial [Candidatus Hodarchaeales archaeon]